MFKSGKKGISKQGGIELKRETDKERHRKREIEQGRNRMLEKTIYLRRQEGMALVRSPN